MDFYLNSVHRIRNFYSSFSILPINRKNHHGNKAAGTIEVRANERAY